MSYLSEIAKSRHFWVHLARSELRSRFRYSRIGILWALLQPLMTTALYTFIFGSIFNRPVLAFATYIFSGLITWELISGAVLSGSSSLLSAESYIRQCRIPYAIYPLRTSLVLFTLYLIAFCGLIVWDLSQNPHNFGIAWVSLLPSFAILFIMVWSIALISSFFQTKFRDFSQVMVLVLQTIFYLSPIFFDRDMFNAGHLSFLLDYNPVAHILELIRAPLLRGEFPGAIDYAYASGTACFLVLVAALKIWREEPSLIFYF